MRTDLVRFYLTFESFFVLTGKTGCDSEHPVF